MIKKLFTITLLFMFVFVKDSAGIGVKRIVGAAIDGTIPAGSGAVTLCGQTPISAWKLNDDNVWADLVASNNLAETAGGGDPAPTTGTGHGGTLNAALQVSNAVSGSSNNILYITKTSQSGLDITSSPLSISAWVYIQDSYDVYGIEFLGFENSYVVRVPEFDTDFPGLVLLKPAGGRITVENPSSILWNTWYHLVVVYDGTDARIYVNGTLSSGAMNPVSYTGGIKAPTSSNRFFIGGGGIDAIGDFSDGFRGRVDDVAVFNVALTPTEIACLDGLTDDFGL